MQSIEKLCEQYVLRKLGYSSLDDKGLSVSKKYFATLQDVKDQLELGSGVIVVIDGGEIDGNETVEMIEDRFVGEMPDHAIVVLSLEEDVVAYNPKYGEEPQRIPRTKFIDAWRDSKFYMLAVNAADVVAKAYRPAPLDLSDVTLPESLEELTEAIAENTHEVWSQGRKNEGWTYGSKLDDEAKTHPDLLPYASLTEGEKDFDRATAMNAIKLIVKLGYRIEKCQ